MSRLINEQWKFLKDVAKLIDYAEAIGVKLTGGELWRPQEMQEIYKNTGRSLTLNGQHPKRLAIDLNFFIDNSLVYTGKKVKQLGAYWESLSPANRWGGNFKKLLDTSHFERFL